MKVLQTSPFASWVRRLGPTHYTLPERQTAKEHYLSMVVIKDSRRRENCGRFHLNSAPNQEPAPAGYRDSPPVGTLAATSRPAFRDGNPIPH